MIKSVEVRAEIERAPVIENVEIDVPTGAYRPLEDGTFVPVTEKKTMQQVVRHDEVPIKVVGVLFDGSRETYYEREYADLAEDVGSEKAAQLAALAEWAV